MDVAHVVGHVYTYTRQRTKIIPQQAVLLPDHGLDVRRPPPADAVACRHGPLEDRRVRRRLCGPLLVPLLVAGESLGLGGFAVLGLVAAGLGAELDFVVVHVVVDVHLSKWYPDGHVW